VLTISSEVVGKGDQQVDIRVTITAPGGSPGIESATVTAIDNTIIKQQPAVACPGELSFLVTGIRFALLPIYIEAVECQAGVDQGQTNKIKTSVGPLYRELIGMVDCKAPGQNQNNPTCTALQKQIQDLRNLILQECAEASKVRGERDVYAGIAGALFAAAVALFIAAAAAAGVPIIGEIIAAALIIAGAVFLAAAEILGGLAINRQLLLNKWLDKMAQDRANLSVLVGRLTDVCCPEFVWVARDIPACP
jgi:hypothetical protein